MTTNTPNSAKLQHLYQPDGSPRPIGVIGYPVEHSLSPALQNVAFDYYKLPHRYQKWAVAPSDLAAFITKVRSANFLGLNVTVPHKQAVLAQLDKTNAVVKATSAANTLLLEGNQLRGYNTDPAGFLEALQQEANFAAKGKHSLVLGAGGAARAVVAALANEGAVEIVVANRTLERAAQLVAELGPAFPQVKLYATPFDPAAWSDNHNLYDLIVNTTSLGLLEPNQPFPIAAEAFTRRNHNHPTVFFDLTYGDTPFLRMARPIAAHVLDGLSMLVYQGAHSFELWTGLEAPRTLMLEAARQALAARHKPA
jgi:shikimate dehydrogenase